MDSHVAFIEMQPTVKAPKVQAAKMMKISALVKISLLVLCVLALLGFYTAHVPTILGARTETGTVRQIHFPPTD